MASLLHVRRTGRRLTIVLDDPRRQNALSAEMVGEIEGALDAAPSGLAALVIEGANGVFSAGADLKSLSAALAKSPEPGEADPLEALNAAGGRFFARFAALPFVTIAVVDGPAVGGGMGLAAAADIVVATARARFALSETSLGIPPAQIAPYLVARLGERDRAPSRADRRAARRARGRGARPRRLLLRQRRRARREARGPARVGRALRARRQRRGQAAFPRLPNPDVRRLYRDGGEKLRRSPARPGGARGAERLHGKARAVLGEERMSARFSSVLVANRGEIACRIIRAARDEGLRAVAVYSDADAEALHVRLADAAVRIGPAAAAQSYLSIDALIAAAKAAGAEAVHPGYGFLAESADFAERCAAAGLVFVGPPPAAMRAMGDKSAGQGADDGGGRAVRARLSWRRPEHGALRRGSPAHRLSCDGEGERRRRRARHADRPVARGARRRAALGERGSRERLRRRAAASRARPSRRPPRRDPGLRRRARRDRPSRRARLLDPAPPSEADRGIAVARRLARVAGADGRGRGAGGARGRLCRRGNRRISSRRRRELLFSGDEHAHPGRASGDRMRHRDRPRAASVSGRARASAAVRPSRTSPCAVMRSKRGSMRRILRPTSFPRPAASSPGVRAKGRACGSIADSKAERRSGRTTIPFSPR